MIESIVIMIVGLSVGFLVCYLLKQNNEKNLINNLKDKEDTIEKISKDINHKNETIIEINKQLSEQKAKKEMVEKNIEELKTSFEDRKKDLEIKFENIANRILNENTKKNTSHIKDILTPLKENINKFEKSITDKYDSENRERASLKTEIKNIYELNKKLSDDANNLTNALRGDKKLQGNWGEGQLKRLLEACELKENIHFKIQESLIDEYGKTKIPDVIIYLPDNKNLIIDSKVSLNAYVDFCNSEDTNQKDIAINKHINNIKTHIKNLHEKHYQDLNKINSPDYVMMFMPIESSLTSLINKDLNIFDFALEKKIVLVSPTTLIAIMKTVSYIWKQENQKENITEIVKRCGDLYDKFVGFSEDMIKVGKNINIAKDGYTSAMNKLTDGRGSLVNRVENIKKLGVKSSKSIDERLLKKAKLNY